MVSHAMVPRARSALLWLLLMGCAPQGGAPPVPTGGTPRNLVLFITDGGGTGTWSVARVARGDELAVAGMPVMGLIDTRNTDGGITDSAAGATAYAIGERTFNGAIGVATRCRDLWARDSLAVLRDPGECEPRETLLERAESAGKATGMITTTWITDATPASFAAHVPDRYMHFEIAEQMLASGVDLLMGGGRVAFDGSRSPTSSDLLGPACQQADCPADAAELWALEASPRRLIGLFAGEDLPAAGERSPTLAEMTRVALERLALDPEGFFLLVETEATDTGQHGNQPIEVIAPEISEFDRAVEVGLAFAERNPGTLVVVTADHDTGGMSLHGAEGRWAVRYTSEGHTGLMVPLFAAGPGSERFAGLRDNDEVGRILRSLLLEGGR